MNLELRPVESLSEAVGLTAVLETGVAATQAAYREEDPRPGVAAAFLERHFAAPETLLVVAEAEGQASPMAFCLTGPLEDPWTGERTALVVGLWVRPDIRHRGVARALVREARRLLARRGLTALAARTAHNDDAVLSMGERWGFVRAWEYLEADA